MERTFSNREHSFDKELAEIVGIEKAILLKNFDYWCSENERRGIKSMCARGSWWTSESLSSLSKKYKYMRRGNLSRWLHELNDAHWLRIFTGEKGNNFYAPGVVFVAWNTGQNWQQVFQNETARCFKMKQEVFQNETTGVFQNEIANKDIEKNNIEGEYVHAPAEKIKITLIEETLFDLEQRSAREANEVFAAIQNSPSLKTEIQKALSPSAAPPPFPETPTIFETWLKSLTNDPRMREGFTITQKIPSTLFEDYVTRFTALARTQPGKYVRPHDLTGHFLNWSGVQYRNNQGAPGQAGANTTTTRGSIPQNVKRYGS